MSTPTPAPLRIRSVEDLLGVIPGLLGFHPEESLVVVVVEGGLVQVAARLDLAEFTGAPDEGAPAHLVPLCRRYPDASYLVVAYSSWPEQAWTALDRAGDALDGCDVLQVLHADECQWYETPWGEGTAYDARASAFAAEVAYRGLPVRSGRHDLERLLDPAHEPADVLAAVESLGLDQEGPAGLRARATTLHREVLAGARPLTLPEMLVLALAAHDADFADEVVLGLTRDNAARAVDVWVQVVRGTTPGTSGPATVLLGMAAWIGGQGALQVVCLTKAAALVQGHPWLAFCDLTNRAVVPPSCWDSIRTDFVLARRGADVPTL